MLSYLLFLSHSGPTQTVNIETMKSAMFSERTRRWWRCPGKSSQCEEKMVLGIPRIVAHNPRIIIHKR